MGTLALFLLYSFPALRVQIVSGLVLWIYLHFRELYGSQVWWGGRPACTDLLIVPCGYGGMAVASSCGGGLLLCLCLCGSHGGLVWRDGG